MPPDAGAAAAAAAAEPAGTGPASTAATASAIIAGASLIARFTPEESVGFPANRALSRTSTSLAKITPSAAAITAGSSFLNPPEPWVSIVIS